MSDEADDRDEIEAPADDERLFLPAGKEPSRGFSVTLAQRENVCPRSAFFYMRDRGGPRSHPMERGSAFHRVAELATLEAIRQDGMPPPDVVKAIANEVLADVDYRCPVEEHDYLRESAFRWAESIGWNPQDVIAVEGLFELDLGTEVLRGKVDHARLEDGGVVCVIEDYKTSKSMAAYEELARTRPGDGTLAAKALQLVAYALLLAFGVPVRVSVCGTCYGSCTVPLVKGMPPCPTCEGTGRVETREEFPLAGGAQRFDIEFVYPGIEDPTSGLAARRQVSLTRLELEEYRDSFTGLLAGLRRRLSEGVWPAVPGSHCSECAAPLDCPWPGKLRGLAGSVNSVEQAAELAAAAERTKAVLASVQKELRAFAKAKGVSIRYGRDRVMEFFPVQESRKTDHEGLAAAVERARTFGEDFELGSFVKVSKSTPFKARTLSAAELAEEREVRGDDDE